MAFVLKWSATLVLSSYTLFAETLSLTPQQAVHVRALSALTFSPDGTRLAFVVSDPPKGQTPTSHIWIYDVEKRQARQLTFSSKSESSPRWSPNGQILAFLSSREERMQVYLLPMDGGEARAVTEGKNAIGAFRWSPDGERLFYSAPEPPSEADEKKDKEKDDAKLADRPQDLAQLWTIDLETRTPRQVTHGAWKIHEFEPKSNHELIAVASNQPREERWNSALYSISIPDGKFTRLSQPPQPFGGINLSPDCSQIAYRAPRNGGPAPHDLFLLPATGGGAARNVTASLDRPIHGLKWQNATTAVISVPEGFENKLFRVQASGAPVAIPLAVSNGDFDIASTGALAYRSSEGRGIPLQKF